MSAKTQRNVASTPPARNVDYILDILHDDPKTLRDCCIVAKSWIPRARKHLFAEVKFLSPKALKSWKKTFQDPPNSSAYYTRPLLVKLPQVVTAADVEEGGWIRTFSRPIHLDLNGRVSNLNNSEVSLTFPWILTHPQISPRFFYPTPYSQILGLVCSPPLLEGLTLILYGSVDDDDGDDDDLDAGRLPIAVSPLAPSPVFTGTLGIVLLRGMSPIARRLIELPNELHSVFYGSRRNDFQ